MKGHQSALMRGGNPCLASSPSTHIAPVAGVLIDCEIVPILGCATEPTDWRGGFDNDLHQLVALHGVPSTHAWDNLG